MEVRWGREGGGAKRYAIKLKLGSTNTIVQYSTGRSPPPPYRITHPTALENPTTGISANPGISSFADRSSREGLAFPGYRSRSNPVNVMNGWIYGSYN